MESDKQHPLPEDLFALLSASGLISLGVNVLQAAGLLSGGTAGLALVGSMLSTFSFGEIFFMVNLPFYYLAYRYVGTRFTINTLVAVTLISFFSDNLHHVVQIEVFQLDSFGAVYAAVIAGILTGVGMLILFRHNASLGGVGILSVYLQKKLAIPAGTTLLVADLIILVTAFLVADPFLVVLSAVSAALVSAVLVVNHKPWRYQLR